MNIALVAEVKWEVREVCRRLKLRPINPDDGVWGTPRQTVLGESRPGILHT